MSTVEDQPESSCLVTEQMRPPEQHRLHHSKHLAFLGVAALLIAGVWMLSILGCIPGLWSGIFSAFFAILSVLLALFPILFSSGENLPAEPLPAPAVTQSLWNHHGVLEGVILGINDQKGSLIVYVPRYLRGSTINLCSGFRKVDLGIDDAASVVARRIKGPLWWLGIGGVAFVAVFPSLNPGPYTVYTHSREFVVHVTVHAELVTEIDWR